MKRKIVLAVVLGASRSRRQMVQRMGRVIRRKAEVVLAVHAGLLTLEEACTRYRLTAEEFHSWQTAIERHGLLALRTTQLQQYRHGEGEPGSPKGWHAPRPPEADRFVFTADDVS